MNERGRGSGPSTLAVHGGDSVDGATGALDAPLVMSSAFAFDDADDAAARFAPEGVGLIYGRWANPTVNGFEAKMATLESAESAAAFASGMGAIVGTLSAFLSAGDHVIAPRGVYAETARVLTRHFGRYGVETTFVNVPEPSAIAAAMRPRTRVVWIETPANPTLAITDIQRAKDEAGDALVVVDSTFATPFHQNPLAHAADLVVHSATKAIGGHGDVIGGVIAGDAERVERVRDAGGRMAGATLSPMSAWLLARGARTLAVRQARASANAQTLAERLRDDPRVATVHYPGLETHPGHPVARAQMRRGFGSLLGFEIAGGAPAGRRAYDAVELITRAVSLGDVRTLLTHPASTTHSSMPSERRVAAGISDGLMRLSVGIEDVEDLWADLDRALAAGGRG
jgi:methionine-gamma-lyase